MLEVTKEDVYGIQCNNFLSKKNECNCILSDVCNSMSRDELVITAKNGEHKYLSISMIEGIFENKSCYIHTFNDITDIKKSQIEKEKHLSDLSRSKKQLLSMMEDLEESKQIAEAANKAKSEFLANMSHEIRTPLNAVIGFTELLLRSSLDEKQKQYCENANISGNNLLGIINTILDFSKIEAGRLDLEIIETNIIQMAEQTINTVKYQTDAKGLELKLSIENDLPIHVFVDPLRLKQILINLLANAVKFTQKGVVELKISKTHIDEQYCTYRFMVSDTGIGMSTEVQQKIFKPFVQGDNSTTRKYGGTGLGLTISRMLTEKMNSTLQLNSEENKGSKFFFDISTRYRI